MTRLIQILPFSLFAFCLAQEDSGLYVNRIKIETFHNNLGNDKVFTYYVADSFDQSQKDNFKTEAGSIGNLYEDDYAADTATCTNTECPKLRRIFAHANAADGTRIIDADIKTRIGATSAKPIGFVAPYPGYCSSDDSLPIIEMYSESLKKYAYWSPAQPGQLVNLASTTVDKSRYDPVRLVGYALSPDSEKLVLENAQPDFVKSIGKSNYTHSFALTYQIIQGTSTEGLANIVGPPIVDQQMGASKQFPTTKNTGIFLTGKLTSAATQALERACGTRNVLFSAWDGGKVNVNLHVRTVLSPYTALASAGYTFRENRAGCGGIKGLAALREFQHKTKQGHYTYENDPAKIQTLLATGEWTQTAKDLGYTTLDQIGFALFNRVI
ncbi:hypothetical protein L5515_007833 [Caenorhabditis briggsae]|uniref:Uncharacterized protein n=1 Tax=Caenorhabditis briggsae TaxID=6238 RepID=A0AAE9F375_CAEBR|nr:hypothetical protein L5515_007833 [Caenorhabditis briggsae]